MCDVIEPKTLTNHIGRRGTRVKVDQEIAWYHIIIAAPNPKLIGRAWRKCGEKFDDPWALIIIDVKTTLKNTILTPTIDFVVI